MHGSETSCLQENEIEILKTEKAMLKTMCSDKLIDKRT